MKLGKNIFLKRRHKRYLQSSDGKLENLLLNCYLDVEARKEYFQLAQALKNTPHKLFIRERMVGRFKKN